MMRANFAGAAAGALLLLLTSGPAAANQNLDKVVAVVGQGVILQSELEQATQRIRQRMGDKARRMPENVLRSQVLDRLILKRIQTQRAERAGMSVSDQELNQAMQRLAQQNGMDRQQFMNALRTQGMQPDYMRERLRDDLLINKLRKKEVARRVSVTPEEVDRYLQSEQLRLKEDSEYHIRHILVAISEGASPDAIQAARERTEKLRERAVSGDESFADLAIAHSDGQKALEGGDLGWLSGGFMPTIFSEVVPGLSPGDVSKVFRGPSGFHLIKLTGIRDSSGQQTTQSADMVQEVKARHILLRLNEIRDNERAKAEIAKLRQRLQAGDDFAELARSESDDKNTANQGGDLGWIQPGQMPPAFAEPLRTLEPGSMSEPFRTSQGWHIVQVQDRRERDLSEERRRQKARQAIGQRKMRGETEVWRRKLRDEAYVDIRMEGYQGSG